MEKLSADEPVNLRVLKFIPEASEASIARSIAAAGALGHHVQGGSEELKAAGGELR
jgi:hypothetical protein